ncbi:hypothetical protein Pfo_011614 [Paulownia fortunei]|nr:hypothetical protein Pfo_011614 [Paulownia fortunei]
MAAYAALVSLVHLLHQIPHSPARHLFLMVKKQIELLRDIVSMLQHFLEHYSKSVTKELEDLEAQIADAAYAAEDIIESHIVDQILSKSTNHGENDATLICQDIQKLIENMDSIKKEAMKMKGNNDQQPINHMAADLFKPTSSDKNCTVVGFDERSVQLMEVLTGKQSNLQIISIVGMGGIGKTTLVRYIYDNPLIMQYFDIRAWVTISQEYTVLEILLGLLHDIGVLADKKSQQGEDQLAEQLYKILSGRRYLIVMDDLWSTQAWDKIKNFFPNNSSGSRIMVTTRQSNIAEQFLSHTPYKMDLLDENQSWNMLHEKVFAQEGCPPELVEIGKSIARNCKGLPLAISVIGGVLANSKGTRQYWEYIAENVRSFIKLENDGHCLKLLYLSYSHLPTHLKPYFLYMGIFSEDSNIRVSRLIRLWVAEGFLKPIGGQTIEKVAEKYLKELIDRNLIMVNEREYTGNPKSCSIHDMLRDLCLLEGKKEKFLWVTRVSSLNPNDITTQRRFGVHDRPILPKHQRYQLLHALQSAPPAHRSLVSNCGWILPWNTARFKLLRVLDDGDAHTLEEISQLVNSRYLAFTVYMELQVRCPSSISLLWNLQTIIVTPYGDNIMVLPSQIWEMPQLRHIEIKTAVISEPPTSPVGEGGCVVLENLQTLLALRNFRFTTEFLKKTPNLNKLALSYAHNWSDEFLSEQELRYLEWLSEHDLEEAKWSYYNLNNLFHLQALESLSLKGHDTGFHAGQFALPHSLKKLTLFGCEIPGEDVTMIGSLPNLEVLKLKTVAFQGCEWHPVEGEYQQLKFLLLDYSDPFVWTADSVHFPRLETLVIRCAYNLEEIPSGIGEIPTLRSIELELLP